MRMKRKVRLKRIIMAHKAKNIVLFWINGGVNFLLSSKNIRTTTKKTKKSAIPAMISRIPFTLLFIIGLPANCSFYVLKVNPIIA